MNSKEKVYRDIVSALGPKPSLNGVQKTFELMQYSAEERSELISFYDNVFSRFLRETRGYVSLNGLLFPVKFLSICLLTLIVLYAASQILNYPFLYSLVGAVIIFIGLQAIYPSMRPFLEKAVWKQTVEKVTTEGA